LSVKYHEGFFRRPEAQLREQAQQLQREFQAGERFVWCLRVS